MNSGIRIICRGKIEPANITTSQKKPCRSRSATIEYPPAAPTSTASDDGLRREQTGSGRDSGEAGADHAGAVLACDAERPEHADQQLREEEALQAGRGRIPTGWQLGRRSAEVLGRSEHAERYTGSNDTADGDPDATDTTELGPFGTENSHAT